VSGDLIADHIYSQPYRTDASEARVGVIECIFVSAEISSTFVRFWLSSSSPVRRQNNLDEFGFRIAEMRRLNYSERPFGVLCTVPRTVALRCKLGLDGLRAPRESCRLLGSFRPAEDVKKTPRGQDHRALDSD